jgi:pyruvate formate lyase activating enzyme
MGVPLPHPATGKPVTLQPQQGSETAGFVHSWDVSIGVDVPGTRFALFTAGCPLRCLYCENPDTWTSSGGQWTQVSEVMTRVHRYERTLKVSGGGVTVSGGEPLAQPRFTGSFLHSCHELGLHTALDTSGYLGHLASDALLEDVDLVLLDIKSFQPDLYRKVTGHELAPTLHFAERLAELGKPVWIRFVLVPGLTDTPENVDGLAAYVSGLPNVERVDVLAYHRLGLPKYAALGIRYPLEGVPEPDDTQIEDARRRFADRGLIVT